MSPLLSLTQAAEFFQCHPDTVRIWAATGVIRGAKVGRAWRFKQSDLDTFFEKLQGDVCRSTRGAAYGGSTSATAVEKLDAALERQTALLRSASTTNLKLVSGKKSTQEKRSPTHSPRGSKKDRVAEAT